MVLSTVDARDFKVTTKTLKKHAESVGIPADIEPKARQGAITDDSLSGLSEEARQELSKKSNENLESADESDDTLDDANEMAPDYTHSGNFMA